MAAVGTGMLRPGCVWCSVNSLKIIGQCILVVWYLFYCHKAQAKHRNAGLPWTNEYVLKSPKKDFHGHTVMFITLFFLFNRKLRLQFVCFLLLCLHWRWLTAGQGSWHTCLRATLVLLDCSQTFRWTLGSADLQAAVLSELLTFFVARLWTFPGFCVLLYFKIHCDKAMGSWS